MSCRFCWIGGFSTRIHFFIFTFLLSYLSTCLLVYLSTCLLFYLFFSTILLVYFTTFLIVYFLKHWPSGPMLTISRNVRLFVCVFTFEVPFQRFLPPLPKAGCPIFLEIRNPWGKSNGKKWSQIGTFLFGSGLKSRSKKKLVFWLILPYKTW